MGQAHDQLKLIRETLGLSQAEMAEILGAKRASSYAYYEDPKGYKGSWIPDRLVETILRAAEEGKFGDKKAMVQQLLGPSLFKFKDNLPDADLTAGHSLNAPWPGFTLIGVYFLQFELQVQSFLDSGPPDDWTIVRDFLVSDTSIAIVPEELFILRLSSPGQYPPFRRGDEFLVDRSIQIVNGDGIYLLIDKSWRMHIRRLSVDHSTNEVIATTNHPDVPPVRYSRPDNLQIIGKVIWQGRSLFTTPIKLERDQNNPPPRPVADYETIFSAKAKAKPKGQGR